jgi:hypothetical protein
VIAADETAVGKGGEGSQGKLKADDRPSERVRYHD